MHTSVSSTDTYTTTRLINDKNKFPFIMICRFLLLLILCISFLSLTVVMGALICITIHFTLHGFLFRPKREIYTHVSRRTAHRQAIL